MKTYRFKLHPRTAFGTPLLGETLFGSLCWAIRHQFGEEKLEELLDGYTEGRPFCVVSDAFPTGFVPLPALPQRLWNTSSTDDRKYLKKKAWLPFNCLKDAQREEWRNLARTDAEVLLDLNPSGCEGKSLRFDAEASHNTINRETLTTGEGEFAPYLQSQIWHHQCIALDVYVVLDEERFALEDLVSTLVSVGLTGFGRDASIGLGKYEIDEELEVVQDDKESCTCLALASCALGEVENIDSKGTFYRVKTHFGRHGAEYAIGGQPFKRPILLAQSGAVIALKTNHSAPFIGQGLTGISNQCANTVHQGYCPVIHI